MKKVILFGAGQIGAMISRLLSSRFEVLCFIDNFPKKAGTELYGIKVLSPKEGLKLNPDAVFICVSDEERALEMKNQLKEAGYTGEISGPEALNIFDPRVAQMKLLCEQIKSLNIEGDAAELGVYKGEFAAEINAALPEKTLHLFDTFEGFAPEDLETEKAKHIPETFHADFTDTSSEYVLSVLPNPCKAKLYKGYFPDTFKDCKAEKFCFVSIDADLYAPTAAALPIFFERLSPGGAIMVHDVLSTQFPGVKKAVDEFCQSVGIFYTPVCDLHGSVIIRK